MGRAILLTGHPGSGKTTLIKRIVSRLLCKVGGFYTQEIREKGKRKGFKLITLDGCEATLAHVDINSPFRVGKYGVDISALDSIAVDCIRNAVLDKDIVVIDEIGPMEMLSEKFRQAVLDALESNVVVFGSIVKRRTPFTDTIKSLPNVSIIEVRKGNLDTTAEQVLGLLQETGCCKVV